MLATRSTNTAPVFRNADNEEIAGDAAITRDVLENSAAGRDIGDPVAAYDAQGDVLTYTISGGEASFDIDRATGQIMVGAGTMLDFEATPSYTVMVTATGPGHGDADGDADSDTITVNITVTNVDEDPELTGMESVRFAENTPTATAVGTYMAEDDEDGELSRPTLTLSGTDASDFNLTDTNEATGAPNDGTYELAFKAVPDFEMPADAGRNNVYNITVTATDSNGQKDMKAVTVTVTNVKEDGAVTLNTLQPRVGIRVMATLTDLDGATSGVTWKWEGQPSGDCPSVSFAPDGTDDLEGGISGIYTPTAGDIGKCLRATAQYTDPQGSDTAMSALTAPDQQPVEKDDTNKAPEFPDQDMETDGDQTDQKRMVPENTTDADIGSAVVATDLNGDDTLTDTLTYTLGGTDAASFNIVTETGQLRTKAPLNKEEKDTYMVTVTATDPSGLSATVNVTIKVTNVDEAPTITRAPDANVAPEFASATTSRTVAENTAAGEDIGNPVAANDANGDALTYALSGTDAASFDIDPDTGQLMTKVALDFETKGSYTVMVTATDPRNLSATTTVTITVTNVDEGFEVSGPAAVDYAENDAMPVATYMVSGPDAASATWTLEGDDAGDFMISSGGMLSFVSAPDYETPMGGASDDSNTYMVTVKADDGTYTDTHDVMVTVTDVDEEAIAGDPLLDEYDPNGDGTIEKADMRRAVADFFGSSPTLVKADMRRLVSIYFSP